MTYVSSEHELQAVDQVDILGVGISAVDLPNALDVMERWIEHRAKQYICAVDVHSLMQAQRHPEVKDVLNGAGLATADGAPLLWGAKWAGSKRAGRVAGPRLMPALCQRAAERGWKVYFLGGEDGVPEKVADQMRLRYPSLQVAGTCSPPFRELTLEEDQGMIDRINQAKPDIVWVAFGAPKQELWMASHRAAIEAPLLIAVGAAFAMHAGLVKEAPRWIQPTGLEWVYRIAREPRRLTKRYASSHPAFVWSILRHRPFLRRSPAPASPPPTAS